MEEIKGLVQEIGDKLQELEKMIKEKYKIEKVEIEFPKGVLRTAREFRNKISFINDETLKRNIAYHLILTDCYRWIFNRFNIGLTAKEMLIKEGISLFGNICAALVRHIAKESGAEKRKGEKEPGYSACLTFLKRKGIINEDLKNNLQWLWGIRCKEHIENLKEWEYQEYTLKDYNKAVMTWQELCEALKKAKKENEI